MSKYGRSHLEVWLFEWQLELLLVVREDPVERQRGLGQKVVARKVLICGGQSSIRLITAEDEAMFATRHKDRTLRIQEDGTKPGVGRATLLPRMAKLMLELFTTCLLMPPKCSVAL
jgi:hypothetical protein